MWFAGFTKRSKKIGDRCQRRVPSYGSRRQLQIRMQSLHPIYPDFVSGAKCGDPTYFFWLICQRDVRMKAHGAGEFKRHLPSDGHWNRDVCYLVHAGLPVCNRLLEAIELSANQNAGFKARPFVDLAGLVLDLLPEHAPVGQRSHL